MQGRSDKRPESRSEIRSEVWLWGAVLLLSLAIIITLVVKGWPLLYPEVTGRAPLNRACDLRQRPCSVDFPGGGRVQLEILPEGIPAVRPLQLTVRLSGMPTPARVEVDFAGVDMDMGFNRTELVRLEDDSGGPWFGQGMLPVCVRDRMTWEARVLLHYPGPISGQIPGPITGQRTDQLAGQTVSQTAGHQSGQAAEQGSTGQGLGLSSEQRLLAAPFRFESLRSGSR